MNQITGIHCILELFECPFELLDSEKAIRRAVTQAAEESGSTLLALTSHKFNPQGVTALGLLAESHISIHTWPETGYAAADVFTCGQHCEPRRACRFLTESLQAGRNTLKVLDRGRSIPSNVLAFPQSQTQEEACFRITPHPPYG